MSFVNVGDRVLLRDRMWKVSGLTPLSSGHLIELEAVDREEPGRVSVVSPPDHPIPLPSAELVFDLNRLDSYASWVRSMKILDAGCIKNLTETTGARFGRMNLEGYQLAPTLRLLSKPRPSLLVADDVGLGKTIEAGLAMMELAARGRADRVLIVTPPGLLLQWRDEMLEKFDIKFDVIESATGLARAQSSLPAGINPWDALPRLLVSIDYLKKETVHGRALRKKWDLVIVDEAHSLAESGTPENPYRTQRTRLGERLRENSRGIILLTATPHNGYPHSFRSLIELVEPTAATLTGDKRALGRRVHSAMIRRMKSQITRRVDGRTEPVFQPRTVKPIPVKTEAAETDLLKKVGEYCSKTVRSAQDTDHADLVTFAMQIVKKRALSSRRALEHTIENRLQALKEDEPEPKPAPAEIRDLQADLPLSEVATERTALKILRSAVPREERLRTTEIKALNAIRRGLKYLPKRDPKISRLVEEIRATPDKVIVFTEYLDTLEAIRQALDADKELTVKSVVMRGGLSLRQRVKVQEAFEGPDIKVLLATDAASEGLNLQRACHRIIHVELPWNPNRLEQRNGRVDRYGQTRPPEIRYLYYPDSPEDGVLNRIVGKIQKMQEDRVSTPDILGVIQGIELDEKLVMMQDDADSLVKLFEDRTREFIRDVQPILTGKAEDVSTDATPLKEDDGEFESIALGILGSAAKPISEGVHRIDTPVRLRGQGVEPVYVRATFRRSVASRFRATDMEFITRLHPLSQTLVADARRRFVQIYPDERGLPPRRMSVRRGKTASILFTFLGSIRGDEGTLEEQVVSVQVTPDLEVVETHELHLDSNPGEAPAMLIEKLFKAKFNDMRGKAAQSAVELLKRRASELGKGRTHVAAILRDDLETDLKDRLAEIDAEERRAKGLVEKETLQVRLFADEDTRAYGFDARREAAKGHAERRRDEIATFERVLDPEPPSPLGALFIVPEAAR